MPKRLYEDMDHVETPIDPLFGQHKLLQVSRIPEGRLKELMLNNDRIANVDEYLNLVRYELEMRPRIESSSSLVVETSDKMVDISEDLVVRCNDGDDDVDLETTHITSDFFSLGFVKWRDEMVLKYDELNMKYMRLARYLQPQSRIEYPSSILNWKTMIVSNKPNLSLIDQLDLVQKFKLISLFQRWCSKKINDNFIKWIMVIILMIPTVLSYTETSILRSFAKKLGKLLPVVEDIQTKICYNWCLVIVIEKFGQRDLVPNLAENIDTKGQEEILLKE